LYPTSADPTQGTFIEQQVKGLRQAGAEIEVLHLDRRAAGSRVYARTAELTSEAVRCFRPDVVHAMYGGILADRVTASVPDLPKVVSFCGSDLLGDAVNGWHRRLVGALGILASQRAARRADAIIVKSAGLGNALAADVDRGKVTILSNGIDTDRFRPLDRAECRRQLGWPAGGFQILFSNGLGGRRKRLDLAMAAVEALKALGVPAELRIIPGVPHDQVPIWLNAADAVLLTSAYEGSPNMVKEALACDRPVVSVDVGDVKERLEGVTGCHVADADPESLARALAQVHSDRPAVDGRRAIRRLTLEHVSGELISIYRRVLAQRTAQAECAAPFRNWLILSQYYAPEPGAPQIRLRAMSRELVRNGCRLRVLTALPNYPNGRILPAYRGKLTAREIIDGVPVDRLPLYPAAGRQPLRRILCYVSFSAAALLRLPFIRKPDVIFVEAQPITLALAALMAKFCRRIPFIYNTPDLQVEIAGDKRWISMDSLVRMAARLEVFLMRQAVCVSTVTEGFIDHFAESRGIERSHITFLPNGADTESLRPMEPDRAYAERLGVAGKVVFTYAGTHAPYQGLELILDAAEHLRDREDIVILMVGRGPLREPLRTQAAERGLRNVVFGDSPFEEMSRLMSITRASLATIAEMNAAPKMRLSKVVPPLACGVPVIYVGEGEWSSMLRDKRCGRVVESRSAAEFATVIRELADQPDLCSEMGRNGREFVETELSWRVIVDRWIAELRRLPRFHPPGRPAGIAAAAGYAETPR
jgi:glycosyltransferase involved in cell wall biosynthesis